MPEIALTEDQYERLDAVREDLEDAFVDNYGYIPVEDAIEYLLDTYTPPDRRDAASEYERIATAEYPQLQHVASEVPGVPGSGIDADEMRGKLLAKLGVEEFASRLEAASEAEPDGTTVDEDGDSGDESAADTRAKSELTPDTPESSGSTAGTQRSSGGLNESGVSVDTTAGDDPLAAVNRILSEHDGKWRESGGDEPYEVDLPDGTTESARTRDDVRQLLFQHY
ncbi:hypothetical protein BRC61_00310 [Halobacteriales archaeon QH_10_65_19]|nr:MAG: hypothetical protein BRC61_00310 [Halobacteriales archaeon QH_10_65_19]